MAYASGASVLLLAIYMAIDVTSRRLGGPFSGISDTVSSFVILLVGTWSLAYALASDTHVKIDVLRNLYPPRLRALSDIIALTALLVMGAIITWQVGRIALDSFTMGAYLPQSIVSVPLFVPQTIMVIGYLALCMQALRMLIGQMSSVTQKASGAEAGGQIHD